MKKIYLLQYKKPTDAMIENRIKSISATWIKYFDDNYIVETEKSSKEIYELLKVGFEDTSLFIIELNKTNYYGRMNTKVWDWLKART